MTRLLDASLLILAFMTLAAAADKPTDNIYKFLDDNADGTVTVGEATNALRKILPLGDVKDLDTDSDGNITLEEFTAYYEKQYSEWKQRTLS